jgi:hypothetical protein
MIVSCQQVVELDLQVANGLVGATYETTLVVAGRIFVQCIVVSVPTKYGEEFATVVTCEYISAGLLESALAIF